MCFFLSFEKQNIAFFACYELWKILFFWNSRKLIHAKFSVRTHSRKLILAKISTINVLFSFTMQEKWSGTIPGVGCGNSVTTREARKLASAIEEKDAALALINDEEHKRNIIRKTLPRVRVIISKIETLV